MGYEWSTAKFDRVQYRQEILTCDLYNTNNVYADSESSTASTSFLQTPYATNNVFDVWKTFHRTNRLAANLKKHNTDNEYWWDEVWHYINDIIFWVEISIATNHFCGVGQLFEEPN